MARNGSGSYTLPEAAFVYATAISETAMNSNLGDIASALTASIAKDGQTDPTANLPMAGFRHTGVDDAVARSDYAAWGQVQDDAANYVTSAGSADAQTLTPTPAISAYAAGQRFTFKAGSGLTNTGAMTIAVSGLAAKNVKALDGTDPDAGAVTDGNLAVITYDGTNFVLQGQSTPASARLFLGLGTAALVDTGVSNGNVPAMDATGYPAADGSQITALAGGNITADTVALTSWAHGTQGGTLYYGASGAPAELAAGTSGQFLKTQGAGANPVWADAPGVTDGGALDTSSGTSVNSSDLGVTTPKRITLTLDSVSLDGTDNLLIQLGDSGGIETTGYTAASLRSDASGNVRVSSTSGFIVALGAASRSMNGVITLINKTGNVWVASGTGDHGQTVVIGGRKELSGAITQITVKPSGSDNLDGGSIQIHGE